MNAIQNWNNNIQNWMILLWLVLIFLWVPLTRLEWLVVRVMEQEGESSCLNTGDTVKNILSIVMILMIVDCYPRQEGTCALRIRRIHSLRCSRSLKTPGEVFIIIIIGIIIMALVMAMMMMTKIMTDKWWRLRKLWSWFMIIQYRGHAKEHLFFIKSLMTGKKMC